MLENSEIRMLAIRWITEHIDWTQTERDCYIADIGTGLVPS